MAYIVWFHLYKVSRLGKSTDIDGRTPQKMEGESSEE